RRVRRARSRRGPDRHRDGRRDWTQARWRPAVRRTDAVSRDESLGVLGARARPPPDLRCGDVHDRRGQDSLARDAGKPLPPDAIRDSAGRPSRDAEAFYAGGALLPLGGASAGHKGYGLGLTSALFGALGMIGDDEPTLVGVAPPETADARGRIA